MVKESNMNISLAIYFAQFVLIYAVTLLISSFVSLAQKVIILKIPSHRCALYLAGSGRSWQRLHRTVKVFLPASISGFALLSFTVCVISISILLVVKVGTAFL